MIAIKITCYSLKSSSFKSSGFPASKCKFGTISLTLKPSSILFYVIHFIFYAIYFKIYSNSMWCWHQNISQLQTSFLVLVLRGYSWSLGKLSCHNHKRMKQYFMTISFRACIKSYSIIVVPKSGSDDSWLKFLCSSKHLGKEGYSNINVAQYKCWWQPK